MAKQNDAAQPKEVVTVDTDTKSVGVEPLR